MLNVEDFVDIFIEEINKMKNDLIEYFNISSPRNLIESRIEYEFTSRWLSLDDVKDKGSHDELDKYTFIAVDSSYQGSSYAHGRSLYVIRSIAIDSGGRTYRDLTLEYNASQRPRTLSNVVKLLAESSEYRVALRAIRSTNGIPVVLLDGSIYTRLVHLPTEHPADRHKDVYLRAMQALINLIDELRSRKGLLVGIVKDSTSEHLRLALIKSTIISLLSDDDLLQKDSISAFFKTVRKKIARLDDNEIKRIIRDLLRRLRFRESDYYVIMRYAKKPGISRPLILGCLRSRCLKKFHIIEKRGVLNFVTRTWRRHIEELGDDKEKFIKEACKTLLRLKTIPVIFTTYVLPRFGEPPLRVDVLVPEVRKSFFSFHDVNFVREIPEYVKLVLNRVIDDYVDVTMYNPLLFAAHRLAKITKREFKLYEIALRNMGVNLMPRRRMWVA
ncbi:MAG: hypothetical protein DRJ66_01885 [Thermoprotei archaeon]|nr:MAG: hypothetical protein DRJ66_01885 [Thermoprotei archaeon]